MGNKALVALWVMVAILLLIILAVFSNLSGYYQLMSEAHTALRQVLYALWIGVQILFWTGLVLGVLYALIKLNHMRTLRVIKPDKHGPVQALVGQDGKVEQLNAAIAQMDPLQQLALLDKVMKVAQQSVLTSRRIAVGEVPELDTQKMIAAPREDPSVSRQEQIPDVIHYDDVEDEIPQGMELLGIHPDSGDLELTIFEKFKMLWIVGSSSSGKSNTVYGKAEKAAAKSAHILTIDQHAGKDDSLTKLLEPLKRQFSQAFPRKNAFKDTEVLAEIDWFINEFERRVNCPCGSQASRCSRCAQKIVLIADEMNRMARNETLLKPLKKVVAICGEESRGFNMYGWFISQKCTHLKWLRDSAITVIVHRLTRFEEAMLACNEDRDAAKRLLKFKVGRTYIYGVDFDPMELQQTLHKRPKVVESTLAGSPQSMQSEMKSGGESERESISSSGDSGVQPDGQRLDYTFPFDPIKLKKVRQMIIEKVTQNKIICEVWEVPENSRAFREAKEEFLQMLAYLASLAGGREE